MPCTGAKNIDEIDPWNAARPCIQDKKKSAYNYCHKPNVLPLVSMTVVHIAA